MQRQAQFKKQQEKAKRKAEEIDNAIKMNQILMEEKKEDLLKKR